MGTKSPPSLWYTSRTVWVLLGAVLSNLLAMLGALGVLHLSAEAGASVLAVWNSILAFLGIIFRWQAAGPLGGSSGTGRPPGALALAVCFLLPFGLVASGCSLVGTPHSSATLTPAQEVWSTYGAPLKVSAAVYEETMREVGRLHAQGALSDEQLEQVRQAGRAAGAALRLARSALAAYLSRRSDSPPGVAIFAAQSSLSSLLQVAEASGVHP